MWIKAEEYYTKKILDSLTIMYIKNVMEDCPPTVSGKALKNLFALISKSDLRAQLKNMIELSNNFNPNPDVKLDENYGGEILVNSKCDKFSIKDFIEWYSYRNMKIDFTNTSSSNINLVKDILFKMVRDKRLIKIARQAGYASDPNVQFEMSEWKNKLAYWKQKSISIETPLVNEEEAKKIYAENRTRYDADASLTYEQKIEKVKNDLMLHKQNILLHNYLDKLNSKYPVKINTELLSSVHLSDENLSKKIDLFILKKGGTLPRQAFPTIDHEWINY